MRIRQTPEERFLCLVALVLLLLPGDDLVELLHLLLVQDQHQGDDQSSTEVDASQQTLDVLLLFVAELVSIHQVVGEDLYQHDGQHEPGSDDELSRDQLASERLGVVVSVANGKAGYDREPPRDTGTDTFGEHVRNQAGHVVGDCPHHQEARVVDASADE